MDRPIVVQAPRELGFVVAVNLRPVLRNQSTQTDRRRHLAVGQVMHDLARRPFPWRRMCVELLVGRADERLGDRAVSILVLVDQLLP
jgi:hypothetical protein